MEALKKLKTKELQELLRQRGLPYSYRLKVDLIERLGRALRVAQTIEEADPDTSDNESESEGEDKKGQGQGEVQERSEEDQVEVEKLTEESQESQGNQRKDYERNSSKEERVGSKEDGSDAGGSRTVSKFTEMTQSNNFSFKDVEESLESFSGDSRKDVAVWLKNFKDIALVCEWSDVQKYLYARRLLKGAAKLAVEATTDVYKWEKLEAFLLKEFSHSPTSLSIHRALENRKRGSNETFLEYMYSMKLIAKEKVDEESLLAHIIEGIQDEAVNKTVLYEAKTFDELKEKFRIYEVMKSKAVRKPSKAK